MCRLLVNGSEAVWLPHLRTVSDLVLKYQDDQTLALSLPREGPRKILVPQKVVYARPAADVMGGVPRALSGRIVAGSGLVCVGRSGESSAGGGLGLNAIKLVPRC